MYEICHTSKSLKKSGRYYVTTLEGSIPFYSQPLQVVNTNNWSFNTLYFGGFSVYQKKT